MTKYILFTTGVLVCLMRWQQVNSQENQFAHLIGQEIIMRGYISKEPSISSSGNHILIFKPEGFSQQLRISSFQPSAANYKDYVEVRGMIKLPENFSNFNYVKFLQKDNIFAEVSKAKVIPIKRNQAWQNYFTDFRQWIFQKISQQLSDDHTGLILGMLIGDDSKLSQTTKTAFQKTGLTHILVVSGFNLTILAASIGAGAWVLGRKFADLTSLLIIWSFVLVVGLEASVTRAAIMVSLLLIARLLGRLSYSYITLLWAIFIMTAINPLQLIYDIGFQLSIAATFGVLQAYKLKIVFDKDSWLSEILWPSVGAIIYTLPIVAYYFQTISLVALPVNLLIVPTIPLLMLLGVLLLIPGINLFIQPIIEIIFNINIKIVNWFAGLPFSVVNFEPSITLVICYYILLFLVQYFLGSKPKPDLKNIEIHDKLTKIKL